MALPTMPRWPLTKIRLCLSIMEWRSDIALEFGTQVRDHVLKLIELGLLAHQEAARQAQLLAQAGRRDEVGVGELAIAAPEVADLHEALVQQRVEHVMGLAQAQAEGLRQPALRQRRVGFQQPKNC